MKRLKNDRLAHDAELVARSLARSPIRELTNEEIALVSGGTEAHK